MKPLPVYIIKRSQVEAITSRPPIPQGDLDNYLSVRPGILDDNGTDIFCKNCRSEHQSHTAFELFSIQDHVDSGTVIVFPFWLELFHAYGQRRHIADCINWLACTFPGNPVVVQWNSDTDASTMPEFQDLPPNFFVLQFNTSKPSPNDIVLPAWAIETSQMWNPKSDRMYRGSFMGYVGNVSVRKSMLVAFQGRDGWLIRDTTDAKQSQSVYMECLMRSDFALCPRGGGLGSYRTMEAVQCGAIPVMFADSFSLPYKDLDWDSFSFRIPENDAGNFDIIWDRIGGANVKEFRKSIESVRPRFCLAGIQKEIFDRIDEWLRG